MDPIHAAHAYRVDLGQLNVLSRLLPPGTGPCLINRTICQMTWFFCAFACCNYLLSNRPGCTASCHRARAQVLSLRLGTDGGEEMSAQAVARKLNVRGGGDMPKHNLAYTYNPIHDRPSTHEAIRRMVPAALLHSSILYSSNCKYVQHSLSTARHGMGCNFFAPELLQHRHLDAIRIATA